MTNKKLKVGNVPNRGKSNTPRLRFSDFNKEWKRKNGNEIFDNISNKKHNSHLPILAITQEHGAIPREFIDYKISVTDKSIESYKVVNKGDFIISLRSFQGGIEYSEYDGICSPAYIILKPKIKIIDKFFKFYLKTPSYITSLNKNLEGIRDGKMISYKYFSEITLPFPTIEEQNKIAIFFDLIETRIQTQNKIIEELKLLKITISKKLFLGQLRFKNEFENEFPNWKNMKLGDIGEVKMCRRIFNDETSPTGDIPFFKIGSFGKEADAFISKQLYEDYRKKFSFPKKGDILISAAGTIGRTVVYKGEDSYYQDSNIVWIDNNNMKVVNDFLYYILQTVKYNTEGGTIQRLYNNILKSTKFSCPSLPEQTKIANFLSSIDSKIDIETQLLQKIETQKKFLLQQMFV